MSATTGNVFATAVDGHRHGRHRATPAVIARFRNRFDRWFVRRSQRAALAELRRLNDAQLADLGVERMQINLIRRRRVD